MAKFPFADWQADHVRLTAFTRLDSAERDINWWEIVTETKPEEVTTNPRKLYASISGPFANAKLTLRFEGNRIDWILAPPDQDLILGEFPDQGIGPVDETFNVFGNIVERWFGQAQLPVITRMAFGAGLFHPESSRKDAYDRLPDYVPVRITADYSDFRFQINLPRKNSSIIAHLGINRLSNWAVAKSARVTISLSTSTASRQAESDAMRLELDINTMPEWNGEIEKEVFLPLYKELVEEGVAVAANGVSVPL